MIDVTNLTIGPLSPANSFHIYIWKMNVETFLNVQSAFYNHFSQGKHSEWLEDYIFIMIRKQSLKHVSFSAGFDLLIYMLHKHFLQISLSYNFQPRALLLLLLSHFSRVRLCATPQTAAHQAPLSLGFSRQEHWSGLPFPFPVHACMLSHFSRV